MIKPTGRLKFAYKTIEGLDAKVKELEQQLLEANAKIEELATRLSNAETVDGQWLELHDADVIAGFHGLLDKRLTKDGTSLLTRAIAMGFANDHIKQLRKNAKGDRYVL
jgi:multidrug resistance efflux pump